MLLEQLGKDMEGVTAAAENQPEPASHHKPGQALESRKKKKNMPQEQSKVPLVNEDYPHEDLWCI